MVDNGIVQILMDLLDRHVEDGNVTVQHAALSALRNLAIPGKPHFASLITQRWNSVLSLHPSGDEGGRTQSSRGSSDCCFSFRPVVAFMSFAQQLWPAVLNISQAYWPAFAALTPQDHPQLRKGQLCNRQGAEETPRMISPSFLSRAHGPAVAVVSSGSLSQLRVPTRQQRPLGWNTESFCNFLRLWQFPN